MTPAETDESRLPVVLVTSVIRSANKGQSHGGVYLVDLANGDASLVIDWDTADIDWTGRGGDRGLRGIAFAADRTYLAASDEVFVYDREFRRLGSFRNRYLKHCHEIHIDGDDLYLTATGFDSVLRYDLNAERFVEGLALRFPTAARWWDRATTRLPAPRITSVVPPQPALRQFDPERGDGPAPADTCHLNSVTAADGVVFVSGTRLWRLYEIRDGRLATYATIPPKTHNARPFRDGVLANATGNNQLRYTDRSGRPRQTLSVPTYPNAELENADLATGMARQGFGRGLAIWRDRYVIAGSSPATVSVFDLDTGAVVQRVNLSMDVRNAVHGLEVWPFARSQGAA